ncbi:MAG TPA: DUF6328 family protein, partial [Blastocatellia bacterium]|nr:DUF6328 family protein [Blastocatellia bacterium]
ALLPFAVALAIDLFLAAEKIAGTAAGFAIAGAGGALSLGFWYGWEVLQKHRHPNRGGSDEEPERSSGARLKDKIEHVLTETRVVLPGAQTLLGFQFITILTDAFEKLPKAAKYAHLISLCMTALSIVLLMTPAAYHRIVERGEETERFHRIAGRLLLAAMVPLALGVCGDFFVVTWKVTGSMDLALTSSLLLLGLFYGLWFGMTIYWRSIAPKATEVVQGRAKSTGKSVKKRDLMVDANNLRRGDLQWLRQNQRWIMKRSGVGSKSVTEGRPR